DEVLDAERRQVRLDLAGHVERLALDAALLADPGGKLLAGEMRGQLAHLGRVGAARMQHGAAAPVDGARVLLVERHDVARHAGLVLDIEVGERLPAAPQAQNLDLVAAAAIGDALDDGIETRDIAAAGEDTDALLRHAMPLSDRLGFNSCVTHPVGESPPNSAEKCASPITRLQHSWFPSRFSRSGEQ